MANKNHHTYITTDPRRWRMVEGRRAYHRVLTVDGVPAREGQVVEEGWMRDGVRPSPGHHLTIDGVRYVICYVAHEDTECCYWVQTVESRVRDLEAYGLKVM